MCSGAKERFDGALQERLYSLDPLSIQLTEQNRF